MASTFLISDIHLGSGNSKIEMKKERRLLSFLEYVAQYGERLLIVGDLFDFWFEYRTVIPKGNTRILCALSQLNDLGKELHYIAGNHDFWMKSYLRDEFGMQIHFDSLTMTLEGKKFYITHGDGIARDDYGYRLLKRIFRNKINIFLYSLIHPDIGVPLAKWVSSLSRQHTWTSEPPNDKDYVEVAMSKFNEGFDYAIFGHLHFPKYQMFGHKVYINLGDWIENFSYAEFDGEDIKLLNWRD